MGEAASGGKSTDATVLATARTSPPSSHRRRCTVTPPPLRRPLRCIQKSTMARGSRSKVFSSTESYSTTRSTPSDPKCSNKKQATGPLMHEQCRRSKRENASDSSIDPLLDLIPSTNSDAGPSRFQQRILAICQKAKPSPGISSLILPRLTTL